MRRGRGAARFVTRALYRRWWVAGAIFLVWCGLVGLVISRQSEATRYRSTAFVRFAQPAVATTTAPPNRRSAFAGEVLKLALAAETRREALVASDLPPDDKQVSFDARLSPGDDMVALTATAPTPEQATTVASEWATAFGAARAAAGPVKVTVTRRVLR